MILEVDRVHKEFATPAGTIAVLRGVDLQVDVAETVAVVENPQVRSAVVAISSAPSNSKAWPAALLNS